VSSWWFSLNSLPQACESPSCGAPPVCAPPLQAADRFFSEYVHPLRRQQPAPGPSAGPPAGTQTGTPAGTPAGCRVIVSHHRFQASESPLEGADLGGVVRAMEEAGADVAKFAIMPCDIRDSATAFHVLQNSTVRRCTLQYSTAL